jgi:endonuclease I
MRFVSVFILVLCLEASAQIPDGYYDPASGLEGDELREALRDIIDNHDVQSYNSLWDLFELTDATEDGNVWDMYSDQPDGTPEYIFFFGSDQCGQYDEEGDCFNREHSFPSSWFSDNAPMNSDLFHLYPTDGYVNNRRSNYAFGEVLNATWTSSNGSKVGMSSWPEYNGVVFEPIDAYKGDFARTYFYMLTRYLDFLPSWNSPMLDGNDFEAWSKNMLLDWAAADPVSDKEISRNNAVYAVQGNRNPFIDQPEFSTSIWTRDSVETVNLMEFNIAYDSWYSNERLYFSDGWAGLKNIYIYTCFGNFIECLRTSESSIDLSFLTAGCYIVSFPDNQIIKPKKIIVAD